MSRTLKERMRSRGGVIAAWAFAAVAWGALLVMSMSVGFFSHMDAGLPNLSILQSLVVGVAAAPAMVFGIIARRSHPIAAITAVFLAAPLVLIFGGGGLVAVGWLILSLV